MHIKHGPFDPSPYDEKIDALLQKLDERKLCPSRTVLIDDQALQQKVGKGSLIIATAMGAASVFLFGVSCYYNSAVAGGLFGLTAVAAMGVVVVGDKLSRRPALRAVLSPFMISRGLSLPLDKDETHKIKRWADLYPQFGEIMGKWLASNPDRQLNSNDFFKARSTMAQVEKVSIAKNRAQMKYDEGLAQQSEINKILGETAILSSAKRTLLSEVAEENIEKNNPGSNLMDEKPKPAM